MRILVFIISIAAIIIMGFWAYAENNRTQMAIDDVQRLNHDIGVTRARLRILKAEWTYLNRPDRLRDVADLNFNRLELLPLTPEQFGNIEQIILVYPSLSPLSPDGQTDTNKEADGIPQQGANPNTTDTIKPKGPDNG